MTQYLHDHLANVIKDAPPVAVGGIVMFGVELSNWVLILTAIYTIIRIVSEIRSWYVRKRDDSNPAVLGNSNPNDTDK